MRHAWTAAIAAAALLSSSGAALACSCVPYRSAAEQLQDVDLVFTGRVAGSQSAGPRTVRTTFRVMEVLKGRAGGTVRVDHTLDGASCGVTFKPGQTLLVFAHRKPEGGWGAGLCSLSRFPEEQYRRAARGRPVPTAPPVY